MRVIQPDIGSNFDIFFCVILNPLFTLPLMIIASRGGGIFSWASGELCKCWPGQIKKNKAKIYSPSHELMLCIWHEKNMSQQYSALGKLGFTVSYVCGYVSAPPSLLDLRLHPVFDLTGESLILTRRISWSRLYVFGSFLSYFFSQTGLKKNKVYWIFMDF